MSPQQDDGRGPAGEDLPGCAAPHDQADKIPVAGDELHGQPVAEMSGTERRADESPAARRQSRQTIRFISITHMLYPVLEDGLFWKTDPIIGHIIRPP